MQGNELGSTPLEPMSMTTIATNDALVRESSCAMIYYVASDLKYYFISSILCSSTLLMSCFSCCSTLLSNIDFICRVYKSIDLYFLLVDNNNIRERERGGGERRWRGEFLSEISQYHNVVAVIPK